MKRFFFMLIAILALTQAMNARTIFVVNAADSGRGTFRDAIENAEDGDIIRFQVAQIILQSKIEFNFDNNDIDLDIIGPVTLNGANRTKIIDIIDANEMTFRDITFTNGFTGEGSGGAISIEDGDITFINCKFTNNKSAFSGGAVDTENDAYTFQNCLFENNTAAIRGGAINTEGGDFTIEDTQFINNKALGGFDGEQDGVDNDEQLDDDEPFDILPGLGGAFSDDDGGSHTFTNCSFQANQAEFDGGAIDLRDGGDMVIEFCTFINNRANKGNGGAIHNEGVDVEIRTSTFINNFAKENGGAIFNQNDDNDGINGETDADINVIEDCTFEKNISNSNGGAINNQSNIDLLTRCLFFANQANEVVGQGGAIFNGLNATIGDLDNCTLSKNVAFNGGGGILDNGGTIQLDSCTIVLNNGVLFGGGIAISPNSNVEVINTIVALNAGGQTRDVLGVAFNTGNNNLIGDGTGSNFVNGVDGNQVGNVQVRINPVILGIANNGGFTQTHALSTISPALNAGETDLEDDGRTFARPAGGIDDIGAFEAGATPSIVAIADAEVSENVVAEEVDGLDLEAMSAKNIQISYGISGVTIDWTNDSFNTKAEDQIIGFYIFNRIQKIEANWKQITPMLIMAKPGKASYTFTDPNAAENFRYFYRIKFVKDNGEKGSTPPLKIFTSKDGKE